MNGYAANWYVHLIYWHLALVSTFQQNKSWPEQVEPAVHAAVLQPAEAFTRASVYGCNAKGKVGLNGVDDDVHT